MPRFLGRFLQNHRATLTALALGIAHAFTFAPWGSDWLELLVLTGFAGLLLSAIGQHAQRHGHAHRRPPPGPFRLGLLFGIGWFTAGIGWVYVSMHHYGGVAAPLAALATLLFATYLALYPALGAWLCSRLCRRQLDATRHLSAWRFILTFGGAMTLAELARGWVLTGFPWLSIGYAHVEGALAGLAPIGGVYLITLGAALTAASLAVAAHRLLAHLRHARRNSLDTPDNLRPQRNLRTSRAASALPCLLAALGVMVLGGALRTKQWSHPTGKSISVSLLQGNVPQQMKFDPGPAALAREQYLDMIEANPADLVLLPETAWTTRWEATEPALQRRLHRFLTSTHSTVALGLPRFVQVHENTPPGATASRFTGAPADTHDGGSSEAASEAPPPLPVWQVSNSVEVFTADTLPDPLTADTQHTPVRYHYDKRHLVPFGEFIPEGFHWFMTLMSIPLGDQARGPAQQPLLPIRSQRIGFNICYEDIFGEELLSQVKGTRNGKGTYTGGATILANLTNLGWFGNSHALPQHLQIARMRALETARPIIRATNTGMTAVISARGIVQIRLRPHETGTLKATLQGHTGLTPYVRLGGNAPVLGLSLALLAIGTLPSRLRWPGAAARRKRRHRRP